MYGIADIFMNTVEMKYCIFLYDKLDSCQS